MSMPLVVASIFPLLLAYAAFSDLMTYKIPNWLVLACGAAFFAVALYAGVPVRVILSHASCSLAMLAAGLIAFSRGWIGGGDAKLAAAIALWLGWGELYPFLTGSALAGGALAVMILIFRAAPALASGAPLWMSRLQTPGEGVPYGVAMAAAAMVAYSHSFWMSALLRT